MNVRLVLESAPRPQAETERVFHGGTLVIGRGDEADWKLDDPEMFVSRRHCILSDETGQLMVTDASSGGLFIDNSANPVGTGKSVPVKDRIRLRLGDFVIKVELTADAAETPPPREEARLGSASFEFGAPRPEPEKTARPATLPDPFDPRAGARGRSPFEPVEADDRERKLKPVEWENPLGLDLRQGSAPQTPPAAPARDPFADSGGGSPVDKYFGGGGFARPAEPPPPPPRAPFADDQPPVVAEARTPAAAPTPPVARAPQQPPVDASMPADDAALRLALLRGMGLDPARLPLQTDPEAEMEAIGARFRELVDGLMMLLRSRAQEKGRARVAQTIIASEDVNPLKFLATTDDALTALVQPRGKGYLPPDQAVVWAYRDLADHQIRTWRALQAALRRMIDRFDPAMIESEVSELGLLEKLVAGGKSAKMWDVYQEHYRDIARSAEEQFLGEVGADFRDAYENKRSE